MNTIDFSELYAGGNVYRRARLNFNRLEEEEYRPANVFKDSKYDWPGDWEGRAVLGLVLLARAVHREPKYLEEIMTLLPAHLNAKGYFGRVLPDGTLDEQQISGNSWFLRAMIEYYMWKKDEKVYKIIQSIVNNLVLSAKGYYNRYPSEPKERIYEGEAIGSLTGGLIGNWYLSTDIGCAFIMLDGATHAYQILKISKLKEVIDEMIDKFLTIDILKLSLQVHATLSALRGILRYYETVRDYKLLEAVEIRYALYMREAVTENYENYCWFGRPSWTEPCAVIDSFILSVKLWEITGKSHYLDNAHNILFNAMGYEQRPNGGFGCNKCVGAQDEFLCPAKDLFEAFWCCTMRGGEGLARAVEYSYFVNENELIVPFYDDNTSYISFEDGDLIIKETTGYPIDGEVKLEVVYSTIKTEKVLKLFVPSWVCNGSIQLLINGKAKKYKFENGFIKVKTFFGSNERIELLFSIGLRVEATINKNNIKGYTFRHGSLILGIDNNVDKIGLGKNTKFINIGNAKYQAENMNVILSPINVLIYTTHELAKKNRKQILFNL